MGFLKFLGSLIFLCVIVGFLFDDGSGALTITFGVIYFIVGACLSEVGYLKTDEGKEEANNIYYKEKHLENYYGFDNNDD